MFTNINTNYDTKTCYNLISTPRSSSIKIKDDILFAPKKKRRNARNYLLSFRIIQGIKKKLNF